MDCNTSKNWSGLGLGFEILFRTKLLWGRLIYNEFPCVMETSLFRKYSCMYNSSICMYIYLLQTNLVRPCFLDPLFGRISHMTVLLKICTEPLGPAHPAILKKALVHSNRRVLNLQLKISWNLDL